MVLGTFICADCQTSIPDVEQQFKYTQPSICRNPVCNNRQRFSLDVSKSRFVDFQKVRVQEIQSELPRGSIPRSLEIILRAEAVETAQPGDRCDFVGTLIVVPDVGSIQLPGTYLLNYQLIYIFMIILDHLNLDTYFQRRKNIHPIFSVF